MVLKYIYLENVQRKHSLNSIRLELWLAMGSDRIIAKQENSLLELSLNRYVMTRIIYVYHFYQNLCFILRHFLVRKLVDLKNIEKNFLDFYEEF